MATTEAKLEQRDEQPYVGIRTKAAIPELPTVIPQLHSEAMAWLRAQGLAPSGPPFVRYYTTDMATKLDIELGWPTERRLASDGRIHADALPAGRYAVLLYTGPYDQLVSVTAGLLEWAEAHNITWSMDGEEWRSRLEWYITDPGDEPGPPAAPNLGQTMSFALSAMISRQDEQERQLIALGRRRGLAIHDIRLPVPRQLAYNDFSSSAALIDAGYRATAAYLDAHVAPAASRSSRFLMLLRDAIRALSARRASAT
jgi:effector-binding domain-containing protein